MTRIALGMLGALALVGAAHRTTPSPAVVNDNRTPAGTLKHGVLTIRLEARDAEWHPDRDADPGVVVHAFAEAGKPASVPGPLIRVPEGTEVHAFVHNALADSTLVVHGLSARGTSLGTAADTIQVRPGQTREVRFAAGAPGTYYYWGATTSDTTASRLVLDPELNGAFVVDPRGSGPPRDRVFVLGLWATNVPPAPGVRPRSLRFTINGRAWPNTERLAYDVGDTVRFRVVNPSVATHPMHLHGFYFRVDSRGDGTRDSVYDRTMSPRMAVTERIAPRRTMTMSWVPERSGYWIFHCHDNNHALRNRPLDGSPLPPTHTLHVTNHALEMMGGLVMGIEVRPKNAAVAVAMERPRRTLRLVARVDSGGTDSEPAYGYVLQDGARTVPNAGPLIPGPAILLQRGEPVQITVVNELPEATSVHWHGIELDAYYDGVADFGGHPGRISPAIAPNDSFEVHFTPPRAGTFIYHPHADETRQQQAGLSGAIIVLDDRAAYDPEHDIPLLISVPRRAADAAAAVFINGSTSPATRELRVGERYRLRVIDIHTARASMVMRLMADSTPVTWRAVAKDGMELPRERATVRPAVQQMGNGETYDFEVVPNAPGDLRFTVSTANGLLLATQPFRVR